MSDDPQRQGEDKASTRRFGRRRWRVTLGPVPQALVAITGLICAVIVWPSDLAWGCIAVAGGAVLAMFDFDLEFGESADRLAWSARCA